MAEVVRLADRRLAQQRASEWVSRLDRGMTDQEHQQLQAWLQADPHHVSAFVDLARTWDKLEELTALSGLVELPVPRLFRRRILGSRAAAAIAIVCAVGILALWIGRDITIPSPLVTARSPIAGQATEARVTGNWFITLATNTGETRKSALPDGTIIEMNTRSALSVTLDADERSVNLLAGEATFHVAHDPNRPFVVQASGRRIRAVGTVFTVRAKSPDNLSVLVSEGRVAVSPVALDDVGTRMPEADLGQPTRFLEAGDNLEVIGVNSQIKRLSPSDIGNVLAWQNGIIVFQGEPLVEALAEIARYSDARFQLADVSLGEMQIAGVYHLKDLKGFIDSLRVNLGIETRSLADGTLSLDRAQPSEAGDPQS